MTMPLHDQEIDALLSRKGIDPDRLQSRREIEKTLAAFGIALTARTMAKNAALGRAGVPYRLICGRALASPRDALRFAFGQPLRTASFDPPRESEAA
jgi:hypothetical protein